MLNIPFHYIFKFLNFIRIIVNINFHITGHGPMFITVIIKTIIIQLFKHGFISTIKHTVFISNLPRFPNFQEYYSINIPKRQVNCMLITIYVISILLILNLTFHKDYDILFIENKKGTVSRNEEDCYCYHVVCSRMRVPHWMPSW